MKGRSLHVAITIVTAALASFIVWQTGEQQKFAIDNFGFFKKQQDNLVVQYGQKLFWLDADKQLTRELDSNELGLKVVGDYDFFSNGDLLVYHRKQPLTLLGNIKVYLRISSDKLTNPSITEGDDGFYRCQLLNKQCQRFGYQLPLIERGFRVVINQTDDTVYLADTSAFHLYKISQYGRLLASQAGFSFPNQLSVDSNKLWLADTNHHSIVAMSLETDSFASQLSRFETLPDEIHQFPHQFVLSGDNIWVNIADNSMSNGLIQQYNRGGELITTAELQHISDPTSMLIWQNNLLVADFITAQIEQFNLKGQSLGLFVIPALKELLVQRERQWEQGQLISQSGQLAFTITLILGFISAWKLDAKGRKTDRPFSATGQSTNTEQQADLEQINELGVEWWTNNAIKYKRKIYKIAFFYMLPPVSLFFAINVEFDLNQAIYSFVTVYMFLALVFFYLMNYLTRLKIGVDGDKVHLYIRGKKVVAGLDELTLSIGYLFYENNVIPVGSGHFLLFEREKLQAQLLSKIINNDASFSSDRVNRRLWKLKEPIFVSSLLVFMVLFFLW